MCDSEQRIVESKIQEVLNSQILDSDQNDKLLDNLKTLRNLCARGAQNQEAIATHNELNLFLNNLLFGDERVRRSQQLQSMAWQLVANTMVNNATTQHAIWTRHGEAILCSCSTSPLGQNTDIKLMIVYNVLKSNTNLLSQKQALLTVVRVWQAILVEKCELEFDFLHFLFEFFLVQDGRDTVRYYAQLEASDRISFLDYLASYVRHDSPNGLVHSFLLQYISKEFKIKSDCIMRHSTQQLENVNPREAHSLLRVIACASGSEQYASLYAADHALFLNVSSLLRCLVAAGKESSSSDIFKPLNKLEEVALTSNVSRDFETEVSFELKTLLVRCIANLLYKNRTNQGYCLDTEVMPTLFDCTNMDARNPLMKEWSILAIRNACIDCPEIQQVIANLSFQAMPQNDILGELNLEMGSLRIQPGKK